MKLKFLLFLLLILSVSVEAQVKRPTEPKPAPTKRKSVPETKRQLPLAGNSGLVVIIDSPGELYVNGLFIGHYKAGESWQYKIIAGKHIIKLDNGIDAPFETSVVCESNMQSTVKTVLAYKVTARQAAEEKARLAEEKRLKEEKLAEEKRRREEAEAKRIAEEKRRIELEKKEQRIREYEAKKREEERVRLEKAKIEEEKNRKEEEKRKLEEEMKQKAIKAKQERLKRYKARGAFNPEAILKFETSFSFAESGTLKQGCTEDQIVYCEGDERPSKSVSISGFYINKFEVTQELWLAVIDTNYSKFNTCAKCPVENISYQQIEGFIKKLNLITEKNYRLPTEAEWEYAARGGHLSGKIKSNTAVMAWYSVNSGGTTHEVGTLDPNELGLYDMYGNVWEYCSDWYDADYYKTVVKTNPLGPESGKDRVIRGGSYFSLIHECRAANRNKMHPLIAHHSYGFRLVLSHD